MRVVQKALAIRRKKETSFFQTRPNNFNDSAVFNK